MTITSHLMTHQGQFAYMIFDTIYMGRHFSIGIGLGRVMNGQAEVTPIAQATLNALMEAHSASHPEANLMMQEIKNPAKAKEKLLAALRKAPKDSAVFIICDKDKTQAQVVKALNIQRVEPPDTGTQDTH